jgi:hypothetical protein
LRNEIPKRALSFMCRCKREKEISLHVMCVKRKKKTKKIDEVQMKEKARA